MPAPAPERVEVRYEVVSSNGKAAYGAVTDIISADVTMETPTGTVQATPDIPMKLKTGEPVKYMFDRGAFVYISAQKGDYYGDVTCRIRVDGKIVSENTATGKYSIATCKGTAE